MPLLVGLGILAIAYIGISIFLSFKYRGKTFPECDKGYREDAKLREKRHSFTYGLDENKVGNQEFVPLFLLERLYLTSSMVET